MQIPDALHRASAAELKERLALERRGRPFLLLRDREGRQRLLELGDQDRLTVGRDPSSDVALDWDGEVSRVHALLERVSGEWNLVDDGRSRNGTFVNGERSWGRRRLRDGDVVRLGRTLVVFRDPTGRESMRTLPSDEAAIPQLTEAQRRVLVEVCRPFGRSSFAAPASTRQIAEQLVISVETVKTHLRALFEAFAVGDLPQNQKRAELARRAIEAGVVSSAELERGRD
jgi:pSer/pThr/pTyr-binding forkhead associated (FHA) protein